MLQIGVLISGGIGGHYLYIVIGVRLDVHGCYAFIDFEGDVLYVFGLEFEEEIACRINVGISKFTLGVGNIIVGGIYANFFVVVGFSCSFYSYGLPETNKRKKKKEKKFIFTHIINAASGVPNYILRLMQSGTKRDASPPLRMMSRTMVELMAESSGIGRMKMVSMSSAIILLFCAIDFSNSKSAEVRSPRMM